ncbi:ribonuclease Y [Sulfurovum sp. bin170]|uniref:ribonuclease Y n=1 Tax=Sulfurovum sp. bin170 TaxID=2695268 RepID=UPI0013E09C9F|nr:ribonuclease Y [Sulfurovum sp. bin170]NEW61028.1 ribonuclease Y [Sulfurovum sp. bin170]
MIEIVATVTAVMGALASYMFVKNDNKKQFKHHETEAKAKASAIAHEAEHLLQEAKIEIKEHEVELEKKFQSRVLEVEKQKTELSLELKSLDEKKIELSNSKKALEKKEEYIETLEEEKKREIANTVSVLEKSASMTRDEAKTYLLQQVEEQSQLELAQLIRKYEKEAHKEAKAKADYIISQAVTRYSGEFAGERLINIINLPSDEHKGRIIGKEGRNIKSLEQLLGVDIIIDETPGVIIVSNFNLYRRAIATRTIQLLVEDGRIHPGRIEEVHKKVKNEFEQKILEDGENIVVELGLLPMHEELMKLLGRMKYRASYGQNALAHTLEVAKLASLMAAEMDGDPKLALRAGLLHDIGKALTQEVGGNHVDLGADICRRYGEHPTVINAIYAHHGHAEPDSVESAAVCAADTLSASRPGARREVLESFTKRVKDIEKIAKTQKGVRDAYAINAGREIRIFVDAGQVNDSQITVLSKKIAKEIENKVQYPGEIKVTVIREKREVNYAR